MEINNDKLLGQVKSCLSGLLVMSKTGYTLVGLEEDYMETVGKRLADDVLLLGFNSVSEFLWTIPDVVHKSRGGWGDDVYRAVTDDSTRHIQQLVDKTPASKSKARKRGKPMQLEWKSSRIRSNSPPSTFSHRRMGPSYAMDDDDVCDFNEDGFFDDGEEMFSDEDMSSYRNESAPAMVNAGSTEQTTNEYQVSNTSMFSAQNPSENWTPTIKDSNCNIVNNNDIEVSQGSGAIASEHDNFTSSTKVAGPVIPSVGSYFDVVVPMAVSPDNFIVQPYLQSQNLKTLSTDMKSFYQDTDSQPEEFLKCEVGDFFAASNIGGEWYRMMVTKVINKYKVGVKYIDFGYLGVTDISKLRILHNRFKTLPIQAVSAKLAGAHSPKHEVWTLKDKIWFNQKVRNGQFVSIVKEVGQTSDGIVLTLELIDTSNPMEDVYVVNQLLKEIN